MRSSSWVHVICLNRSPYSSNLPSRNRMLHHHLDPSTREHADFNLGGGRSKTMDRRPVGAHPRTSNPPVHPYLSSAHHDRIGPKGEKGLPLTPHTKQIIFTHLHDEHLEPQPLERRAPRISQDFHCHLFGFTCQEGKTQDRT